MRKIRALMRSHSSKSGNMQWFALAPDSDPASTKQELPFVKFHRNVAGRRDVDPELAEMQTIMTQAPHLLRELAKVAALADVGGPRPENMPAIMELLRLCANEPNGLTTAGQARLLCAGLS